MPKYRGRVDCYINPPTPDTLVNVHGDIRSGIASRAVGEAFVNIVNFLSSSSDLGIEMISANYGTGGSGLDFWDSPTPAGRQGWACFRFHSASLGKFDCFVFQMTGSHNESFGDPIRLSGGSSNSYSQYPGTLLGISFASHPSGSNVTQSDGPWNGDYSLSAGTFGNPLWKVNADCKAAFFPRENGIGGSFSGSVDGRGYLTPIFSPNYAYNNDGTYPYPMRLHLIASEDSFTIISDGSNNGNHKVLHFGSFLPRSGTQQDSPYMMFTNSEDAAAPLFRYGTTVGSKTGPSYPYQQIADGAVSEPNLLSGSKTCSLNWVYIDQTLGYNGFVNSGSFEKFPMWAQIVESPTSYGILGVLNHIAVGVGMNNRSVSVLSSSAAFGRDVPSEHKIIVPWSGSPPDTGPRTRTGRSFSFDV